MITWKSQHRIVSDLSVSFRDLREIHLPESNLSKHQETDKMFLSPKKYETQTLSNFKFIVLWTVFMFNSPKIDTLKHLQSYSDKDIKDIQKNRNTIIGYKNILRYDIKYIVKTKNQRPITPWVVYELYRHKRLSFFFTYWYFRNNDYDLGRIKNREIQKLNLFIGYFEPIRTYLDELDLSKYV